MEFVLLLLTGPVFYIIGLVTFVRWLISRSSQNKQPRKKFLEDAVNELTSILGKSPNKTLAGQLEDYTRELDLIKQSETVKLPDSAKTPAPTIIRDEIAKKPKADQITEETPPEKARTSLAEDWGNLFLTWYSDNSINLLVYLGA